MVASLNRRGGFTFEPVEHLFLVRGHPVHVGLGSLQRLFKCCGGWAEVSCIVFFELLQLQRDQVRIVGFMTGDIMNVKNV